MPGIKKKSLYNHLQPTGGRGDQKKTPRMKVASKNVHPLLHRKIEGLDTYTFRPDLVMKHGIRTQMEDVETVKSKLKVHL